MGVHRFEFILKHLKFGDGDLNVNEDKLYHSKCFVEMLHRKWATTISPGHKLTVDESMFPWYGRNKYQGGMPNVMKIKRKPKGVGCKVRTLCDTKSNIILRMEINEGKEIMAGKDHQRELGAGTSTLLRITKPFHGTGRIVLADSWFASMKSANALLGVGLYFVGKNI